MALLLEAFDENADAPADTATGAEPAPSAEWVQGRAAGLAEGLALGTAAAEASGAALSRELAQAMQDTAFGYAEARAQVLRSLQPLFRLLIDRLLPAVAAEALGPWLAEAMVEAARADSAAPLVVAVHPARLEAVRACLPQGAGWPATLVADPSLGLNAARLAARGAETALDLDACVAVLADALAAIFDEPDRKARHG